MAEVVPGVHERGCRSAPYRAHRGGGGCEVGEDGEDEEAECARGECTHGCFVRLASLHSTALEERSEPKWKTLGC